jgi:hypothetical protein
MSGVGLALSAASAFMQMRQGQIQAANLTGQAQGMEVQAEYTRFNAKQESLKHKKTSVDELEKVLVTMASINAIGGAGYMGIFTGNLFGLKIRALNVGGQNYATAAGNELITRLTGEAQANMQLYQAANLRKAAGHARTSGLMNAMLTLAGGAYMSYNTMIPSTGGTATTGPGAFGSNFGFPASGGNMGAPVSGAMGMPSNAMPFYHGQYIGPGMVGL